VSPSLFVGGLGFATLLLGNMQGRKLNLKATFESGSSHFSFKR
jgi:hypothetical protein